MIERLRNRLDIFGKTEKENEFGELTFSYEKIKSVWGEIVPLKSGNMEEKVTGEALRSKTSHKVTIRKGAIKNITPDMYFMFKGQKYEIMYFMPHYQKNDIVEIYCKLVIEN